MEYWSEGELEYWVSRPITPLLHYSILLESSQTHSQPLTFRYRDHALLDRQSEERISGDDFEFAQLAKRRNSRRARGEMHRRRVADHAARGIRERATNAVHFA